MISMIFLRGVFFYFKQLRELPVSPPLPAHLLVYHYYSWLPVPLAGGSPAAGAAGGRGAGVLHGGGRGAPGAHRPSLRHHLPRPSVGHCDRRCPSPRPPVREPLGLGSHKPSRIGRARLDCRTLTTLLGTEFPPNNDKTSNLNQENQQQNQRCRQRIRFLCRQ